MKEKLDEECTEVLFGSICVRFTATAAQPFVVAAVLPFSR
jgi:hypothetical protein